jgi:hypothetical protein
MILLSQHTSRSAHESAEQSNQEENQENEEQDLGDSRRCDSDPSEAENGSHKRNDEESDGPT